MCDKLTIVSDKYLLLDKYRRNQFRALSTAHFGNTTEIKIKSIGRKGRVLLALDRFIFPENVHSGERESRGRSSFRIPE